MSYIKLIDVERKYGTFQSETFALNKVNLDIDKGDSIAILGASGSGKSTLLNLIGCLDRCTGGKILFEGKDITKFKDKELATIRNRKIGFIFQNFSLLNEYNVIENVEIPMLYNNLLDKKNRISKKEIHDKALKYLKLVKMEKYIKKKITELSVGQQQRVAIARALVNEPEIILADEPTGALDKKNGLNILNILNDINEKNNTTLVVVTHDNDIAKGLKKVVKMEDGRAENGKNIEDKG